MQTSRYRQRFVRVVVLLQSSGPTTWGFINGCEESSILQSRRFYISLCIGYVESNLKGYTVLQPYSPTAKGHLWCEGLSSQGVLRF